MKTIFKKVLATLLVGVIILGTPLTGTTYAVNIPNANATVYQNAYSQGNKLLSDSQEELSVKLKKIEINHNQFELDFNLQQYGRFHLDGNIEDNLIENISSSNPRLEVVNIFINNNDVNVIMKDKSDYIYVDFNTNQSYDLVRYNPYWYTQVVEKPIETVREIAGNRIDSSLTRNSTLNSSVNKNISRSYYIFEEEYVETLVARIEYHWPRVLNGGGDTNFWTRVVVTDNNTKINRYNGNIEQYNSSSLYISDASVSLATDKGEYFDSATPEFEGTKHKSSEIVVGCSYGIPYTPFSLSYNFEKYESVSSSTIHPFYRQGDELATQIGANWADSEGYRLERAGDFCFIRPRIAEERVYSTQGRKGLKTSWKFKVYSSGVNGTGVPAYHTSKLQHYTMFFEY